AVRLFNDWEPHLIFMDMRMPVMNGYEATKMIKTATKGPATKIIAVTGNAFEEDRTASLSAGCDDFVRKPFQENDIFEVMARHLDIRYVYENPPDDDNKTEGKYMPKPEDLELMPDEWLLNFYDASIIGDPERCFELIEEIPPAHAELAEGLKLLLHNFAFDKLMTLTQNKGEDNDFPG
ncbi:response regulator, partial [Desulfobacterales bacterium HSG17]|nr:response regulator [Desulfobacterales bacterium HSG17]